MATAAYTRMVFKASLFCIAFLITTSASAQSLKIPTIIFASAATADWVTTYRAPKWFHESNPIIGGLNHRPATMVLTGAAIDVASVAAWNRFVGRNHPKLAAIGLYAASSVRLAFAVRNHQRTVHVTRGYCRAPIPMTCN